MTPLTEATKGRMIRTASQSAQTLLLWGMPIDTLAQMVQSVVVVTGIPLAIWQLSQQTNAIRLQAESYVDDQLSKMGDRFDEVLQSDPELADFYDDSALPPSVPTSWGELSPALRKRYMALGRGLSYFETGYIMWRKKLLRSDDYVPLLTQLHETIGLRMFHLWWPLLRSYYRADFASYLDALKEVVLDDSSFRRRALKR